EPRPTLAAENLAQDSAWMRAAVSVTVPESIDMPSRSRFWNVAIKDNESPASLSVAATLIFTVPLSVPSRVCGPSPALLRARQLYWGWSTFQAMRVCGRFPNSPARATTVLGLEHFRATAA